jgi:uncharacterized membrane protein
MLFKTAIGVAGLLASTTAFAAPQQYRVIETGVQAAPTAFNNRGEIVFSALEGFGDVAQAAIWSEGALKSPFTGYSLPPGITYAQFAAVGVNDHGVVVGGLVLSDTDESRTFRWDSGTGDLDVYDKLVEPDGSSFGSDYGVDISNGGLILGQSSSARNFSHVREGGNVRWLDVPFESQYGPSAYAINENGDVVGEGWNIDGWLSGIFWAADGAVHVLESLSADGEFFGDTQGIDINDQGQGLFWSRERFADVDDNQSFLWKDGLSTPLGHFAPGFTWTLGSSLNNLGAVVGTASSDMASVSFLWEAGQFWDLQSLLAPDFAEWMIGGLYPFINDRGQIATWGCKPSSPCQTLLLDPIARVEPPPGGVVPEPATWAMLITGFGLVGGMLRRRPTLAHVLD